MTSNPEPLDNETPGPGSFYTEAQRSVQDRFDSRTLADTLDAAIIREELDEAHISFIESRDFFFLSTVNGAGEPTVSYKGGDAGTVKVLDNKTLAFPAYDGNGMFLSVGNIEDTAKIGMLFIDFETPNRVRVQATASIDRSDELLANFPGAILVVKASVDNVFVNCARYIHKHTRVTTSPYVPDENGDQPYPSWKRIDLLQDALAPQDHGKADAAGGTMTIEEYGAALEAGES